jgi:thioredoxin reductase
MPDFSTGQPGGAARAPEEPPEAQPAGAGPDSPVALDAYDITVVGGGPTGLFALFYAGMRHMRAKVVDSLPELGGQLSALYPEKYIFDVAGFPKVLAKDLTKDLIEQGLQFGATVCLEESVVDLRHVEPNGGREGGASAEVPTEATLLAQAASSPDDGNGDVAPRRPGDPEASGGGQSAGEAPSPGRDAPRAGPQAPAPGKILRLQTDKAVHWSRTVVLCAGIGAFAPRKLNAEGVEQLLNRGVYYGLRDKAICRGKRVLIVGGGDSAADWSVNLLDTARAVTLIHRSDRFRAHEATMRQIHDSHVQVRTFTELKRVHGSDRVEGVTLVHNQTGLEEEAEAEVVLLNLGFLADLGPMRKWGIEIEKKAVKVNERMETNMPGVYAAGDVAQHGGKLKLIATGFGEAATAVNFAKHYIDPSAKAFPGHSTDDKTFEGK